MHLRPLALAVLQQLDDGTLFGIGGWSRCASQLNFVANLRIMRMVVKSEHMTLAPRRLILACLRR